MDTDEVRRRLLSTASDRLCKMPGAFARFQYEIDNTISGASLVASAQLSIPLVHQMGERVGSPESLKWIQEHLTCVIDRWAETQPHLAGVEPLLNIIQRDTATVTASVLKRDTLISTHVHEWPTIERDLKDANTNGLGKAAKVPDQHGMWFVEKARIWAIQRGKLHTVDTAAVRVNSVFALSGKSHRI
jgi:hypothetical protein